MKQADAAGDLGRLRRFSFCKLAAAAERPQAAAVAAIEQLWAIVPRGG